MIKRRERYTTVYMVERDGKLESLVLPVRGYGLWSTLFGFMAIKSDLKTVVGFGFYQHVQLLDFETHPAGDAVNDDFCHDELGGIHQAPEVLVEARSAEEVSKIMSYACEHRIPVVARGSGTGLVGASVALYGGIMIDMAPMSGVSRSLTKALTTAPKAPPMTTATASSITLPRNKNSFSSFNTENLHFRDELSR